ncbi:MAG: AraC family transcriptional regulator [Lachnospiraceae bacterium]|nr:AraC family transcriptional regulator [Lachnospiraceae bacterium]
MNYYERIQKSIEFIEDNLTEEITVEQCARQAYMSVSGYYRMFLSVVGYSVKEYIRMRRLTMAFEELVQSGPSVITAAIKYGYNSADSFTRAFKSQFGIVPSKVKSISSHSETNKFARFNIMEKYFEENQELAEKYPEIKVIKKLEPMKVACFTYFGDNPEDHAFAAMKKWAKTHGVTFHGQGYRVFGYNNPDPSNVDSDETYGYEVCVTISDELYDSLEDVPEGFTRGTYDGVKRRVLQGGKYAVMSVKQADQEEIGGEIIQAWKRFSEWMHESKYIWGGNQYLEEHLGFTEEDDHIGWLDLYISIQEAPKETFGVKEEEEIPASRAVFFRAEGMDGEQNACDCWNRALAFAREYQLDAKACRIFQYNAGFSKKPPFFHVVLITLPETFTKDLPEISFFEGGTYMTLHVEREQIMDGWLLMEKWRKETKTEAGGHQWVEEWTLENWEFPCKDIKICYPINSKQ